MLSTEPVNLSPLPFAVTLILESVLASSGILHCFVLIICFHQVVSNIWAPAPSDDESPPGAGSPSDDDSPPGPGSPSDDDSLCF